MVSALRDFLRSFFRRSRFEQEMQSELRFHMETYTEDLVRSGVPRDQAERRARIEFGGVENVREQCRQSRGLRWSDEIASNVRFALRMLRKSPTFTLTAIVTLALCIGANTAVYSVVDTVLLRPLPYPQPNGLAHLALHLQKTNGGGDIGNHTGATWEAFRDQATTVDPAVFNSGSSRVSLVSGNSVDYVRQQRVSAGFFRVLGVNPFVGREFSREEDRPEGAAVVVLSHSLWKRLFHEDRGAIGQSVLLRGEPYTIVGIMPPDFQSSAPADLWTPIRATTTGEGSGQNYDIMARLRPGVSWAQAQAEIQAIGAPLIQERHLQPGIEAHFGLVPLREGLTQGLRQTLFILWGAVAMVLLVGCVNIAGLMLARVAARRHEIATRMALGGGTMAVMRQLLTESIVLGLLGGAAGIAAGYAGVKGLELFGKQHFGIWQTLQIDCRVLAMTLLIAVLSSICFGLVPALQACRIDARAALADSASRSVAGNRGHWTRRILVSAEVALVMMLLVAAGLLIRTYLHFQQLRPGFDPTNVLTAQVPLEDARYATAKNVNRLFDESLARIRQLPGVEFAAVGLSLPYERALNVPFERPTSGGNSQTLITNLVYVTPEYFDALRIPLLQGRHFTRADGPDSANVLIVNEAFVKRYLADEEPLGVHLKMGDDVEVVGVIGDVQQSAGWGSGEPLWPVPTVYTPAAQSGDHSMQMVHTWFRPSWIVRTSGRQEGLVGSIQKAMAAVNPLLPFSGFRTMQEVRSGSLATGRFQAALLGTLAGIALLLAAVGIYGLIAGSVVERTREMGIRLALGATVPQAIRAVALPGIMLGVAGIAAGATAACLAVPVMKFLVWGVSVTDPVTFGAVAVGLILVITAASILPALRVARVNPAETLRNE